MLLWFPRHCMYTILRLLTLQLQNSSDEARLLWMRLPVSVKSQLQSLWSVGRAILQHDFHNVYTSTPSTLQSLVLSAFQTRTFNMISVVYKSLSVTDFQTMTGVETRADVEEVVSHLGWRIAEDFVVPKKSEKSQSKTSVSLTELANYISFLENV